MYFKAILFGIISGYIYSDIGHSSFKCDVLLPTEFNPAWVLLGNFADLSTKTTGGHSHRQLDGHVGR